jgi:hypothetical protein
MNKTQKILIILIILLSSLAIYLFLWYFSLSSPSSSFLTLIPFPNDLIKSTTKNNQTNLVQKENNQPTTNQPTANKTSSSSPSANLTNLPQYPVDPLIKEKLTQAGLNPLYQLVKEDKEGRSVVYEDKEKNKGFYVLEVYPIANSSDYYIYYHDLNQTMPQDLWARFVFDKNSQYQKTQLIEKNINEEKILDNFDIKKILQPNDVVRITFQKKPGTEEYLNEGTRVKIAEKIYIQRF